MMTTPSTKNPAASGNALRLLVCLLVAGIALFGLCSCCSTDTGSYLADDMQWARVERALSSFEKEQASEEETIRKLGGREAAVKILAETIFDPTSTFLHKPRYVLLLEHCGSEGVSELARCLQHHEDEFVRRQAALSLAKLGPSARERALDIVQPSLTDKDALVRLYAVIALAETGLAHPEVLAALKRAREDKEEGVRLIAAEALRKAEGRTSVSKDGVPHYQSLMAIMRKGGAASSEISLAVQALKHENPCTRVYAAVALGQMGFGARKALPALEEAQRDANSSVRLATADAAGKIDYDIPLFVKYLTHSDASVRSTAAGELGELGAKAQPAVPGLIEALKDKRGVVRANAAWALGAIGPGAKEAVPALKGLLKDNREGVDDAAKQALKKIVR